MKVRCGRNASVKDIGQLGAKQSVEASCANSTPLLCRILALRARAFGTLSFIS